MRTSLIILSILLLGSCTTPKSLVRYVNKHPDALDQFIDTTVQIHIDTLIIHLKDSVYLPGDTVIVHDTIVAESEVTEDTLAAESKYAKALTWVAGGKKHLVLIQKDWEPVYFHDTVWIEVPDTTNTVIYQKPPKKVTPRWAKPALWWAICTTCFLLITIILLIRALKNKK